MQRRLQACSRRHSIVLGWALCIIALPQLVSADVKLWATTPGVLIMPDRQPDATTGVERVAVGNEYAPAQLGLRADAEDGKTYTLSATALASSDGGQIGADHVTIYREADIHVDHSPKAKGNDPPRARPLGDFPDALVPLVAADGTNVANAIKIPANHTLPFWVDVFVPGGTKAGDYKGQIELKDGSTIAAMVPVLLHVKDVTIPADSTIPSIYNLRTYPHVLANLDAYVAEVMKHRVQPNNTHYLDIMANPRQGFGVLDKYNPGGKGWASIYVSKTSKPTGADETALMESLHEATDHLKSIGLLDRSFIYLKDEPDVSDTQGITDVANDIIQNIPEWKGKMLDTLNHEGTPMDAVLTYHVRALSHYGPWTRQPPMQGREDWDKRRAAGQQLWFYESNAQGIPFPTFDINTPGLAFEPRVLGWAWWYEKANGHLYWDLMFQPAWELNHKFPPGDGQLIYPGDFTMKGAPDWVLIKDLHGPVVSRRLKLLRQGLEDWELLKLAEKSAGREKVQAIVDQVYTTMGQRTWAPDAYNPAKPMWSYTEADWDKARGEVIALIGK